MLRNIWGFLSGITFLQQLQTRVVHSELKDDSMNGGDISDFDEIFFLKSLITITSAQENQSCFRSAYLVACEKGLIFNLKKNY